MQGYNSHHLLQKQRNMESIKAHIESNGQGLYSVYVEKDLVFGLIGEGYSIEEAKADFLAVYESMRKAHRDRTGEEVNYQFSFVLDVSALLAHYKYILSLSGLSKLTGINKAQLSQYVCGTRNPSPKTQKRIKQAISQFAHNLINDFG